MTTATWLPVFKAQPKALAEFLETERLHTGNEQDRLEVALLKTVLPDIVEAPTRMKRLNDALGEWLARSPRSWREMEDARQVFLEVFDAEEGNVVRIAEAAPGLGVSPADVARLQAARAAMAVLRADIFGRWEAFTPADHAAALEEIRAGKVQDLDEVIHELQGRSH